MLTTLRRMGTAADYNGLPENLRLRILSCCASAKPTSNNILRHANFKQVRYSIDLPLDFGSVNIRLQSTAQKCLLVSVLLSKLQRVTEKYFVLQRHSSQLHPCSSPMNCMMDFGLQPSGTIWLDSRFPELAFCRFQIRFRQPIEMYMTQVEL